MTKTVWKYELMLEKVNRIAMPRGASVLRVNFQGPTLCMWACLVPEETDSEERRFVVCGTGGRIPMHAAYVGSASILSFEWHVFEVKA